MNKPVIIKVYKAKIVAQMIKKNTYKVYFYSPVFDCDVPVSKKEAITLCLMYSEVDVEVYLRDDHSIKLEVPS